jgi:LysM repeat protein
MIFFIYTVRLGDTLRSIADYYGISEREILAVNPSLNPKHLVDGQKIIIPITRLDEFLFPEIF